MSFTLPQEIVAKLSSQGVGSTVFSANGWFLAERSWLPGTVGLSTQARQIAVVPTGGLAWEPEEDLDRPTFQLLFRDQSTSSTGLEQKVQQAIQVLTTSPSGFTVKGRYYLNVMNRGNMLYLGRDENLRPMYSQNFLAWRSRST